MYRLISRKERVKLHTEAELTFSRYPQPADPELSSAGFVHVTRLSDTTLQPEAILAPMLDDGSEVVIFLLAGELHYSDSLGNSFTMQQEDVMTAAAGPTMNLELANPSSRDKVHIVSLSLFSTPAARKTRAGNRVQRKRFPIALCRGTLLPVASGQGHSGSLELTCDAAVYFSSLAPYEQLVFETLSMRRTFLYLVAGAVRSEEHRMLAGDSCEIHNESRIPLMGQERSELLLIDLG